MKNGLVSVVMATYNEPREYVTMAISSILNQTYSNLELIIADDSTNQETVDAIDLLAQKDNRIKVIRRETKMGFVPALNIALHEAQGEFIARMDGDDQSLPERFQLEIDYLRQRPDVSVVGGQMNLMDSNSNIVSHRTYPLHGKKLMEWYVFRNPLAHPTVMFRVENLSEGFYYDETFKKAEDLELWSRYLSKGKKIHNLPETLVNFRVVENMGKKRNRQNFIYNFKARKHAIAFNRFLPYSLLSTIVSLFYICMPMAVWNLLYKKENKY